MWVQCNIDEVIITKSDNSNVEFKKKKYVNRPINLDHIIQIGMKDINIKVERVDKTHDTVLMKAIRFNLHKNYNIDWLFKSTAMRNQNYKELLDIISNK